MAQSNNTSSQGANKTRRTFYGVYGTEKPHETLEYLAQMRAAGLARDASKLPILMQAVRETTLQNHFATALHSLALIGGPEALQVTEEALQSFGQEEGAYRYIQAVHARLLAQNAARKLRIATPHRRAVVCLRTFLKTAGHADTAAFNDAIKRQNKAMLREIHPVIGPDIFVLRELADIIYQTRDLTLLQVAKEAGVDFTQDAGASYKVELAPLTDPQRLDWIIHHLSGVPAFTFEGNFLVQLAADQGKVASRAAAARLQEMEQQREQYADKKADSKGRIHRFFPGYYGLLYIIEAVGDIEQEPMLARMLNSPEPAISAHVENIYKTVRAGIPMVCKPEY